MITRQRYEQELMVLKSYFPENTFFFKDMNTQWPCLMFAVVTSSGRTYTLRIELDQYPENIPKVFVTKMLYTKNGEKMDSASAAMHTLPSERGFTRICHYGSTSWNYNVSLYKVYLKCKLWFEIYELHLKTGHTMDYYLNHQR